VQFALARRQLGGLGELSLARAEVSLADRAELGTNRTPGLIGAGLGDADDDEPEEADQHVGADAIGLAVEDGPQAQDSLEVAEGALGLEQLLVAQRDVLRRERRVRGGEQVLAARRPSSASIRSIRAWRRSRSRLASCGLWQTTKRSAASPEPTLTSLTRRFSRMVR
jgi:hypothetical protein